MYILTPLIIFGVIAVTVELIGAVRAHRKAVAVFNAMNCGNDGRVNFDTVTRFEVIDHRATSNSPGRALTAYGTQIEAYVQDGGKTLKIFLT